MEPPISNAADVRAVAVAKLKRAASLPRMKDGRRPAMHTEAVSEGERSRAGSKKGDDSVDSPPKTDPLEDLPVPLDADTTAPTDASTESQPTKASKRRSRSRSRSRSRGSKDFKKMKQLGSPTQSSGQSQILRSDDSSSPEDEPSTQPQIEQYEQPAPPVNLMQFQPHMRLLNPSTPRLFQNYPPMSPMSPPPSLEALQARLGAGGLARSNSAAARLMAMRKLNGEIDPIEPQRNMFPFAAPNSTLARNNTIAGGERGNRSVARDMLFRKLGGRVNPDGDQTSGGEEAVIQSPPPKRARRRSHRRSAGSSTIVDDRDPPSTSPNTPITTDISLPLPPPPPLPAPIDRPPSATPSQAPSQTASAHSKERNRDSAYAKLIGENPFEFETNRRLVIENDDDPVPAPPAVNVSSPRLNGSYITERYQTPEINGDTSSQSLRIPHSSDTPSAISTDSNAFSSDRVPVFLSDDGAASPYKQDVFPTSPWGTPLKEKPTDEEEEEVVYPEEGRDRRGGTAENVVSWVETCKCDPSVFLSSF